MMHLVPRPDWLDRVDRALWRIPGLRTLLFVIALVFCFEQRMFILVIVLGLFALFFIADEFLPHVRKEKPTAE